MKQIIQMSFQYESYQWISSPLRNIASADFTESDTESFPVSMMPFYNEF